MARPSLSRSHIPLRLFYLLVLLFTLWSVHSLWGRIQYERFLNRLSITLDDFPNDYADALTQLPNATAIQAYDYINYPPPDPESNIPPIIHFIWFQNLYETRPQVTTIPSKGSRAPEWCQKANPDFEIKVWNATAARDLLEQHYDWFLPTYDNYAFPIQRVDAIKYFILYHYGGFYLDLDVACRRSLKPLQPFPAWIPRASPQGLNNDAVAARAGHPAWEMMIESLARRDKSLLFPYLTIFWSTGPQFVTDTLKEWFDENPQQKTYRAGDPKIPTPDRDAVYVLPQDLYSEQYTFFGHSPGGTWHESDVAVVLWFVARPWAVLLVFLCGIVAPMMACIVVCVRQRRKKVLKGRELLEAWTKAQEMEEMSESSNRWEDSP